MGKASKATKKFAASGQLKKTIQARHKHQQIRKRSQSKKGAKDGKQPTRKVASQQDQGSTSDGENGKKKSVKGLSVDEFLGAAFMESDGDAESLMSDDDRESAGGDEDEAEADDRSFASVDDIEEEGEAHLMELSQLATKDPEFYKYLQEHDRELLEFDPLAIPDIGSDDEDELMDTGDDLEEEAKLPVLTMSLLRKWQKALLEQRSLKALRKLLIAFRSAAHMNEENQLLAWSIDTASVYNKLIATSLRYTPIVLAHHVPFNTSPNGKLKSPIQTQKFKTLQKLILSYFHNVIHILSQLDDNDTLQLAVSESAKIVPYISTSRKAVKLYLKKCLELWSTAEDRVRMSAFKAIRRLGSSTDDGLLDLVLKGSYLTLVRSSRATTTYTLPSLNFMKNSASEIFCTDHATAYQHAFGYIRQLAIHLRNSMKVKTKEAYKQVYNWQYIHCVDFWTIVLARACDSEGEVVGRESELKALIYPLVQISLGAIKLISNSRSYPFHLHIIRSLLHLTRHTGVYIPMAPYILPILTSTLAPSTRPKSSTLKPLDLEVHVRAPQQYVKTRIYDETIVEETVFLLAEWLSSKPVQGSIAFPEIIVPVIRVLRRTVKSSKSSSKAGAKELGLVKGLAERMEESAKWIEQKRQTVNFGPGDFAEVSGWEIELRSKIDETPLVKYVKVQRKVREKRRKLLEKAREDKEEMLEQD